MYDSGERDSLLDALMNLRAEVREGMFSWFNPYRREYRDLLHEVDRLIEEYTERELTPHSLYNFPTGKSLDEE